MTKQRQKKQPPKDTYKRPANIKVGMYLSGPDDPYQRDYGDMYTVTSIEPDGRVMVELLQLHFHFPPRPLDEVKVDLHEI